MKYFDFVIILIPTLLAVITFVFYLPLCIKSFDIEQSVTYKNVSKNKFKILMFLIFISIGLSFLLLIHKKNLFYYISSWIGQLFIVYVYFRKLDINYNILEKFIRGENLEFEIQKSNNDLSEDIRDSTSKVLNVTKESKENVIESINANSEVIKNNLSEDIINSSNEIKSNILISNEKILSSIEELKYDYVNDTISFIKELNEIDFDKILVDKTIKLKSDSYKLFKDLVIYKIEPNSKIDLIVPYKSKFTNNKLDKEKLIPFLNQFFDLKNISNNEFKNEFKSDKSSFFNKYFLVNGKENIFNRVDFNDRYQDLL
ncbi:MULTISPECIES: hypothetical protein [unclassified Empedobacter]|uniref:hypothetical protein n=1 Tax=unclassified Empedobacter TaxID=2643773 RepID=UPI0025BA8ECE|nr:MULTISPECIES: hypothetical protein [unclassified Empedobacter]